MMIHMCVKLPREVWVACSGGMDSMVAVDFLRRNHVVHVVHVNHGTAHGQEADAFVRSYCAHHHLPLHVHHVLHEKPVHQSWEEFWRHARYDVFKTMPGPVITAHHLDDCVETYLFNCMHGKSHTMPMTHAHVIRPFLTTAKSEFESWAIRKAVPHVTDPSNWDVKHMRNLIRHHIVPEALKVNPGLRKVVRKIVEDQLKGQKGL